MWTAAAAALASVIGISLTASRKSKGTVMRRARLIVAFVVVLCLSVVLFVMASHG